MRPAYGKLSIAMLLLMAAAAILAPWLSPSDPAAIDLNIRLLGPGIAHWLGTDDLGRDLLSRMLYGARVSLGIGTLAMLLTTVIGAVLGAVAGHFRGWVESTIMRSVDVLNCVPTLYLVIALIVWLGPGIQNVLLVIVFTGWTDMARMVRGEVLSLREREFILAARASGAGNRRILFRHLLPNTLGPVYVAATFGVAGAILMESGLSFLGLGVQPPTASWGNLLTGGRDYIQEAWWLTVFPGLAILVTMLLVNHAGESLRARFSPGS